MSRTPLGSLPPSLVNLSGCFKYSTISSSSALASGQPFTSLKLFRFFSGMFSWTDRQGSGVPAAMEFSKIALTAMQAWMEVTAEKKRMVTGYNNFGGGSREGSGGAEGRGGLQGRQELDEGPRVPERGLLLDRAGAGAGEGLVKALG